MLSCALQTTNSSNNWMVFIKLCLHQLPSTSFSDCLELFCDILRMLDIGYLHIGCESSSRTTSICTLLAILDLALAMKIRDMYM